MDTKFIMLESCYLSAVKQIINLSDNDTIAQKYKKLIFLYIIVIVHHMYNSQDEYFKYYYE